MIDAKIEPQQVYEIFIPPNGWGCVTYATGNFSEIPLYLKSKTTPRLRFAGAILC